MDVSKQFLRDSNWVPRISFKKTPVATVKLLDEKVDKIMTDDCETQGVKYLVEENGDKKTFFTASLPLIQALSEYSKGDIVTIRMKSVKGRDGTFRSQFIVTKGILDGQVEEEANDSEPEIDPDSIPF